MKVQFDIKYRPQIESGEYKVETRDGRSVRIICWDRVAKGNTDDDLNLCVLVQEDNGEAVYSYHQSGKKWVPDERFDLFIITPEPELTEFEQEVRDCIVENLTTHGREMSSTVFIDDETTKKLASELLGLARNQLQIEGLVTMEHLNIACEAEYQSGLADGKNEALKDLPRWKKCAPCDEEEATIPSWIVRFDSGRTYESAIVHDGYYICFGELEKLPGFKED